MQNLEQRIRSSRFFERFSHSASRPLTESLFVRLLGLVYLAAFASLWPQIVGLIGSRGVSPTTALLDAIRRDYGGHVFLTVPSLFWFHPTDHTLIAFCALGCLASILLVACVFTRLAAFACFVLYLSVVSIGEPFLNFQWDALLLESGFLALFIGAPWLVWAYRFLLFRLMFESGIIKLASHDPNWRNLHALRYHFMTQPLPNPIAYYTYRAPDPLLDVSTLMTLVIELLAPFLLFGPRPVRLAGAGVLIFLQVLILLTGNYAFFNYLTIALCLWAFDEQDFSRLAPILEWHFPRMRVPKADFWRIAGNTAVAALIALGGTQLLEMLSPSLAAPISEKIAFLAPFEIINRYGLFAVMTTARPEIVLEGSDDNQNWREYSFPFKPGNTHRELPWVAPYQPRLDWQMWFAALGTYESNTWVAGLMYRLMTGEPSVLGLMGPPPFTTPPRYMRALLYHYDFTTPKERAKTGAVWKRELAGTWFGPVSVKAR
ncbi:MAG: lipase maturation factor family protein [Acidobacteriaceae bacterium]|nr:lipase maturation factor family protein [Acidobacteriaceae bacterium]